MKLFTQIFAFYLLSLSLAPCGDGGGGIAAIFDFFSGLENSCLEQEGDPCDDAPCSPFCICMDCIPVLDIPESGIVVPMQESLASCRMNSFFSQTFSSPFYKDIWQPPKLG